MKETETVGARTTGPSSTDGAGGSNAGNGAGSSTTGDTGNTAGGTERGARSRAPRAAAGGAGAAAGASGQTDAQRQQEAARQSALSPMAGKQEGDLCPYTGDTLVAVDLDGSVGIGGAAGRNTPLYGPGKGVLVPERLAKTLRRNAGIIDHDDLPVSREGFRQEQGGMLLDGQERKDAEADAHTQRGNALAENRVITGNEDVTELREKMGIDGDPDDEETEQDRTRGPRPDRAPWARANPERSGDPNRERARALGQDGAGAAGDGGEGGSGAAAKRSGAARKSGAKGAARKSAAKGGARKSSAKSPRKRNR